MHAAAAPHFFPIPNGLRQGRPPRRGERWTLGVGGGLGPAPFVTGGAGGALYTIRCLYVSYLLMRRAMVVCPLALKVGGTVLDSPGAYRLIRSGIE